MTENEWEDIGNRLKSLEYFNVETDRYGRYTVDSKFGTLPCRCFRFEKDGNIGDFDGGYIFCGLNYSQMNEFINLMCVGITKMSLLMESTENLEKLLNEYKHKDCKSDEINETIGCISTELMLRNLEKELKSYKEIEQDE